MPNNDLLLDTLHIVRKVDAIQRHADHDVPPELENLYWNQENWLSHEGQGEHACGTAMCFAGWALWLSGYTKPVMVADLDVFGYEETVQALLDPKTSEVVKYSDVRAVATELLGLDSETAWDLFNSNNSLENLTEMVYTLTGDDC